MWQDLIDTGLYWWYTKGFKVVNLGPASLSLNRIIQSMHLQSSLIFSFELLANAFKIPGVYSHAFLHLSMVSKHQHYLPHAFNLAQSTVFGEDMFQQMTI
ncbi:hypothetical protein AGOR_G00132140 [Albula goreensis]|uniref:Uncharacterized protein n=1 Tax=Albula goreensis TaxID=1534307 RepID=A0A8T3D8D5_9TELE|nr:hypothetical protein AGOR_G00132140 [Albula goreensis]